MKTLGYRLQRNIGKYLFQEIFSTKLVQKFLSSQQNNIKFIMAKVKLGIKQTKISNKKPTQVFIYFVLFRSKVKHDISIQKPLVYAAVNSNMERWAQLSDSSQIQLLPFALELCVSSATPEFKAAAGVQAYQKRVLQRHHLQHFLLSASSLLKFSGKEMSGLGLPQVQRNYQLI